jgi:hypothetical protein
MDALETLLSRVGTWHGRSRLHDPTTGRPEDSASTATVSPAAGGNFVRLDYTWAHQGTPQDGSVLFGRGDEEGSATAHWVDSWHMGKAALECRGSARDEGGISVQGSYPAPPGPDWGWRIVVSPREGAGFRLEMWNITPEGEEAIAVEAEYGSAEEASTARAA